LQSWLEAAVALGSIAAAGRGGALDMQRWRAKQGRGLVNIVLCKENSKPKHEIIYLVFST